MDGCRAAELVGRLFAQLGRERVCTGGIARRASIQIPRGSADGQHTDARMCIGGGAQRRVAQREILLDRRVASSLPTCWYRTVTLGPMRFWRS